MSKRIIAKKDATSLHNFATQLPKAGESTTRHHAPRGFAGEARREEAFKEGFAAGYNAGFESGSNDAREEDKRRGVIFADELRAVSNRVEMAMSLWFDKAEHGLTQLAREIAKNIIAQELRNEPDVIVGIVREALGRVNNTTHARIRLNPFDLPTLSRQKDALLQSCQAIHDVELVSDASLSPGSTIIESESGVVDARIEAKLDVLFEGDAA